MGSSAKKKAKAAAKAAAAAAARAAALARSRANIAEIKSKREKLRDQRAQEVAGGEVGKYGGEGSIIENDDTTGLQDTGVEDSFNQQGGEISYIKERRAGEENERPRALGQSARPLL